MKIRSYKCWIDGYSDYAIYNAASAGKARYLCLLHLKDIMPDITFKDIKVKSLRTAESTKGFEETKRYRNYPDAKIGQQVTIFKKPATLVGGNGNHFEIVYNDTGYRGFIHPSEIEW